MMYICVLDFEATCIEGMTIANQEIIEFPSILFKIENGTMTCIDKFQEYVKPIYNPLLSEFCVNLTGIKQETVDNSDIFHNVYKRHFLWIKRYVSDEDKLVFLTVGDWDLATMLPKQLKLSDISKHFSIYKQFINITKDFSRFYKTKGGGLKNMLKLLDIELVGHHHSGMDDCINTSKILERMINDGFDENRFTIERVA